MAWNLDKILKEGRRQLASDIHLVCGVAPALRVNGDISILKGEPLQEETLRLMVNELLTEKQVAEFEQDWQLCFSRHWPGLGRFRASVYYHAGCPELAIRICEGVVRSREELGLPEVVDEFTRLPNGLILVTGPTGTGKTTTLNYMVDLINRDRRAKIVTIEDPVEFVHENQRSIIIQQEVHTDTHSFRNALTHVLRQDPDVIVIGEMRDLETIATALTAAETGHLVLATLHTPDAVQTIQRVYGVFPAEQQNNIRFQLSNSLQAIIAQTLLPRASGKGLVLACEICVATPAVRKHIREGDTHLLFSEMQMGRKFKMRTMDTALLELYQRGDITYDLAVSNAREPNAIRKRSGEAVANDVRA
ncbi:MAG: PilT/PilU family type 4a pilus ATPase [Planctomycetes bacterium]|nr:PilT/PilU family type 4a pilus ATPase [Planctomycetota bacterium]